MGQARAGGFYYGWVIVGVSFLASLAVSGARMSFGPSFKPMLLDYDTSRGALSVAMSLNQLFYGLAGPLTGWLTDRYGARAVIIMSTVVMTVGIIGTSLAPNLWVLYVAYGVFTGLGFSGSTTIPFSALLTRWFHRKAGMALGISTAGTPVGHVIIVPAGMYIILVAGWRWAYLVLGAIIALVIFPLAWRLVRPDPRQMGLLPDGDTQAQAAASGAAGRGLAANKSLADAMRTRAYWLICLGWFTCGYVGFMVATHLVPFATDVGMEPMAAAGVLALMGVFSAVGSFGAGAISDRVGRKNPLAIVYFSRFLAVPLLMTPLVLTNHVLIYAFAVVFGLGQLATLPLASTMTREIFGQQSMGVILGTILLAHQIGAAIGVYLGGALFDATGSYYWAFLSGALLSLIAAVGSYMIREERRPAYAPNMIPAE